MIVPEDVYLAARRIWIDRGAEADAQKVWNWVLLRWAGTLPKDVYTASLWVLSQQAEETVKAQLLKAKK